MKFVFHKIWIVIASQDGVLLTALFYASSGWIAIQNGAFLQQKMSSFCKKW